MAPSFMCGPGAIFGIRHHYHTNTSREVYNAVVGEGGEVTLQPSPQIIHRQLTLLGSWTFSTFGLSEAARYTAERHVPLDSVITSLSTIEAAANAYERFSAGAPG